MAEWLLMTSLDRLENRQQCSAAQLICDGGGSIAQGYLLLCIKLASVSFDRNLFS